MAQIRRTRFEKRCPPARHLFSRTPAAQRWRLLPPSRASLSSLPRSSPAPRRRRLCRPSRPSSPHPCSHPSRRQRAARCPPLRPCSPAGNPRTRGDGGSSTRPRINSSRASAGGPRPSSRPRHRPSSPPLPPLSLPPPRHIDSASMANLTQCLVLFVQMFLSLRAAQCDTMPWARRGSGAPPGRRARARTLRMRPQSRSPPQRGRI